MSNTVFIRIPSEADQSVSCLFNEDEHDNQITRAESLEDCQAARGQTAVLLVPGNLVTLTQAAIPTRSRQRALKAIPYALEDQLASDVETLHFAHGDKRPEDDAIPVAVIEQQQIQEWIDKSTELDIKLDAIVPDVLAIPLPENGWSILIQGDNVLVRTSEQSGFSSDYDNLTQLLSLALVETSGPKPTAINLYMGDEFVPDGLLELLSEKEIGCEQIRSIENPLKLMQQGYDSKPGINLLQGDYRPQSRIIGLLKPWRTPAIMIAIVILLQVVFMSVQTGSLNARIDKLRADQTAVFRSTFPSIKRIEDPVQQMQQQLTQLQRTLGSRGHGFTDLLAKTSGVLAASKGTRVTAIKFQKGTLELELDLKSLAGLDPVKDQLTRQKLKVEVLSANARGKRVNARLRIKGGTS